MGLGDGLVTFASFGLGMLVGILVVPEVDEPFPVSDGTDFTRCVELAGHIYGSVVEMTNSTFQAQNSVQFWLLGLSFREDGESPTERCETMFLDWCDEESKTWCGRDLVCADPFGRDCARREPRTTLGES